MECLGYTTMGNSECSRVGLISGFTIPILLFCCIFASLHSTTSLYIPRNIYSVCRKTATFHFSVFTFRLMATFSDSHSINYLWAFYENKPTRRGDNLKESNDPINDVWQRVNIAILFPLKGPKTGQASSIRR